VWRSIRTNRIGTQGERRNNDRDPRRPPGAQDPLVGYGGDASRPRYQRPHLRARLSQSDSAQIVAAWLDERFELIVSPQLVAELTEVLDRPKFRSWVSVHAATDSITGLEEAVVLIDGRQKLQRHRTVVDPMPQIMRNARAADADRERCGPCRLIALRPRRVRPDERRERCPSMTAPPVVCSLRNSRSGARSPGVTAKAGSDHDATASAPTSSPSSTSPWMAASVRS
jgi:hypothetical protein